MRQSLQISAIHEINLFGWRFIAEIFWSMIIRLSSLKTELLNFIFVKNILRQVIRMEKWKVKVSLHLFLDRIHVATNLFQKLFIKFKTLPTLYLIAVGIGPPVVLETIYYRCDQIHNLQNCLTAPRQKHRKRGSLRQTNSCCLVLFPLLLRLTDFAVTSMSFILSALPSNENC
jgi:hypothetical protein